MAATDSAVPKTRREELLRRFEDLTEWPLLALAAAVIPILLAPVLADLSAGTEDALETTFWIIWGIFVADLGTRVYLSDEKVPYLRRNWYDLLAVITPAFELALGSLAIFRSARLFRLFRLVRAVPFVARTWASIHKVLEVRGLQYVLLVGVGAIFASAGVMLALEREDGQIDDYGTALWWAVTTITTVGYGDVVPKTAAGKGVAVVLMLFGIAFFSWVTANIAAFLLEFGGGETHGVTTQDLMRKLDAMESEIRLLRAEQSDNKAAQGDNTERVP